METKADSIECRCSIVAAGVARGKAYVYNQIDLDTLAKTRFEIVEIQKEEARLAKALETSKIQLERLSGQISEKFDDDLKDILNVHRLLLEDEEITVRLFSTIVTEKVNIEYLLANRIKEIEKKFAGIQDDFIRSRFSDLHDVYHRVLRNLLEIEHVRNTSLLRISEPSILIAEYLAPSDVVLMHDSPNIIGLVIEQCSITSHVAIASSLRSSR